MHHSDLVFVKRITGKGRGVFALGAIPEGTVIERVPVLLVPIKHISNGRENPFLARFCFIRDHRNVAIALGYGSLYNHSYRPNARYEDGPAATMLFRAIRLIKAGEEITVNYNGKPNDRGSVGFKVVDS